MALSQILLIDDKQSITQQFETILSFLEYQVSVSTTSDYLSFLNKLDDLSAVFIVNGCEKQAALIRAVTETVPGLPVILLIQKGTLFQVSTAISKMVTKIQEWPTSYLVFIKTLKQIPLPQKANVMSQNRVASKGLAGNSQSISNIRELINQVAGSDATVLILGESGTGKEVVAQALHRFSGRKEKPFVPVNCGAIPGELLESELFGHEKGAFTGALTTRQGRFEMAEGGTLFLDEIGDMPMPMQVKLLRVIQERSFERVGSNVTIACNVRIIAATHRNLENEIKEKRFREDLFYRLNVFPIELPSLRQRAADIPLLIQDLIARMHAAKQDSVQFTGKALALMMQHPWPGNVRELSNFIERMAITHPNSTIDINDLPQKFQEYVIPDELDLEKIQQLGLETENKTLKLMPENNSSSSSSMKSQLPEKGIDLKGYLSNLEVDLIQQALKECNGVVAHAAKLLNMQRTTLVEKLRKYELS